MIWRAPERGTRELKFKNWEAHDLALAIILERVGKYRWPIAFANDRDHIRW